MNVLDFLAMKEEGRRIALTTCYDFWSARILADSAIDAILVGDSVAMVVHGHDSTIPATVELMALHTAAVAKGAGDKFVITDLPFLSFRRGLAETMDAVGALMKAGAHAVKIEGIDGHEDILRHIVESGIPVMGHLGLTPQSVNQLGGFTVQGKGQAAADRLADQAVRVQEAGCFSLVLECMPSPLGKRLTELVDIPTIGIGAGPHTDGQVLVLQDLAGLSRDFEPRFTRAFGQGYDVIKSAVDGFTGAVRSGDFPSKDESYS